MKKTRTKAFANLVSAVLLLIFEVWAYWQTLGFKQPKAAKYVKPATFPQVMIIGMGIFTLVLLVQSCIKVFRGMKATDTDNAPAETLNPLKNRGVAAAFFVIALCIVYSLLFVILGYVLVSVLVPLVMWFVFYKFLKVNIPMGVLQPLRDLIDKF